VILEFLILRVPDDFCEISYVGELLIFQSGICFLVTFLDSLLTCCFQTDEQIISQMVNGEVVLIGQIKIK
jgi:hypothetical protein